MLSLATSTSHRTGTAPRGMTVPVILLLLVSAVVIIATLTQAAKRQNRAAIANSVHVARAALGEVERDLGVAAGQLARLSQAGQAGAGDRGAAWAPAAIGADAAAEGSVSSSFVVGGDGRVRHAMIDHVVLDDPQTLDLAARAEGGLDLLLRRARAAPAGHPRPATGLLRLDGAVQVLAAVALGAAPRDGAGDAPAPVLVVAAKLDQAVLDRLAADYMLEGLRQARAPVRGTGAALLLVAVDGTLLGVLSWRPALLGQSRLEDLIPPLSVALVVMIGLAWVFVRRALRVAGELERGRHLALEKALLEESERTLRHSEARYRDLFEQSPISIREEDWSGLKRMVDEVRQDEGGDLGRALRERLRNHARASAPIEIVDVNMATLEIYRAADKQACIRGIGERLKAALPQGSDEVIAALAEGQHRLATEEDEERFDGSDLIVRKWVQIPEEHRQTWSRVLVTVEDITERKRAEDRLQYLALYDGLTGLSNRASFLDTLERAVAVSKRASGRFAVLFLDLDDFKGVNDTLGHAVGDRLLKAVAERLQSHMRESDSLARHQSDAVARFGGDEFTIVLNNLDDVDGAAIAAERVIEVLSKPFTIEGKQIYTGTSVGIAVFPDDGESAEQLLKNADMALYRSKHVRRGAYRFYVPQMDTEVRAKRALEDDLRDALPRGELWLSFQPQVAVENTRIVGMEALARWRHPERGEVSPDAFIPAAEHTNLILPIGEWVLHQACAQTKLWQDAALPLVAVTVNVSGAQIEHQDVLAMVEKALGDTGLDPRYLHIEITESVMMHNFDRALATLHGLRDIGIKVYLDDFGTGYASMSYLKRFPIDTLKIDRSFVREVPTNPDDAAIARAIINMAHTLNLKVTAEGVETEAQFRFLRDEGCDTVQGHYFSPAVPADAFAKLLGEGGFAAPGVGGGAG